LRLFQDAACPGIDCRCGGVAQLRLGSRQARNLQERHPFIGHGHRADALIHAVTHDHGARQLGGALQIVGGSGADIAEDQELGRAGAHEDGQPVLEISLREG
jgi:hypothetical protein